MGPGAAGNRAGVFQTLLTYQIVFWAAGHSPTEEFIPIIRDSMVS